MSETTTTTAAASSVEENQKSVEENQKKGLPWALWVRQTLAILKLDVRKNFLGRRAILIYLLALLPVFLLAMLALAARVLDEDHVIRDNFMEGNVIFSAIYGGLILRTVVFFGCAWIFMNLFRGEVVDRSLHYYFLCPVRREVLVAAKYLSGLLFSVIIFSLTTLGALFFLYVAGYPASMQYLMNGPGLTQAISYIGVTALACVGYGAFFLTIGLFFRNPIIPALVVYGWEFINFLLPPLLKKLSVIHYLHSLTPVPMDQGPFAVLAEPTPAYLSVPGLFIMTLIVLIIASLRIRRMEISYGSD